jgi:hypothetical protein
MRSFPLALLMVSLLQCSRDRGGSASAVPEPGPTAATKATTGAPSTRANAIVSTPSSGAGQGAGQNVVGVSGIAKFGQLNANERSSLKTMRVLYLHQSVGQDLEDGAEANGFKFEYVGPDTTALGDGLHGGLFVDVGRIANGEPLKKIEVFRTTFNKLRPHVASFSFGYADIRDHDLEAVKTAYQAIVAEVKRAGAEFVHVTPPLVFSPEENPAKMRFRSFMLEAFPSDVIFDLQDIESQENGKRCAVGNVWRICPGIRSTAPCPSKGQGVDSDGAGHLCEARAKEIARALLTSFVIAGQRARPRH